MASRSAVPGSARACGSGATRPGCLSDSRPEEGGCDALGRERGNRSPAHGDLRMAGHPTGPEVHEGGAAEVDGGRGDAPAHETENDQIEGKVSNRCDPAVSNLSPTL